MIELDSEQIVFIIIVLRLLLKANISWNFAELKSFGTVPFVILLDCVSQGTHRT